MSFGSRAYQAKPEALSSCCSESKWGCILRQMLVCAREDFLTELFLLRVRNRDHILAKRARMRRAG
jgi:hypothetical protein